MTVKILAYSQPVNALKKKDIETAAEFIAYCARVSNPANQYNNKTADKLINYLVKHRHWSPLEMASATLEIESTRDIIRQMLRHRSFSFQEFSQRYADPNSMDNAFVVREARLQDPDNRQNSIDLDFLNLGHDQLNAEWAMKQEMIIHEAKMAYDWAISKGIAKEQARCVLPEGNTVSRVIMNGTLRSWVHFCDVRTEEGTQKEHRMIAREVAYVIGTIFPPIKDYNHAG